MVNALKKILCKQSIFSAAGGRLERGIPGGVASREMRRVDRRICPTNLRLRTQSAGARESPRVNGIAFRTRS